MHVLGHHRVVHLHPELSGARDGGTSHLDEEEILRMAAPTNVHELQDHRGHVGVQLQEVDSLVREAQSVDAN